MAGHVDEDNAEYSSNVEVPDAEGSRSENGLHGQLRAILHDGLMNTYIYFTPVHLEFTNSVVANFLLTVFVAYLPGAALSLLKIV